MTHATPQQARRQRLSAALAASALVVASLMSITVAGAGTAAGADDPEEVPPRSHAYSSARARQVVETRLLGRSVEGRAITAYRKGNPAAARTVVILGQLHGDEWAGPITARYVIERLPVDSDVDLWVVPTMNPDGRARRTRRNARGVDLNRNWPTNGWVRGSRSSSTYGGPAPASEPETRAMIRFLTEVEPRWITSIHQPFGSIGRNGKTPRYVDRLARQLGLEVDDIGVGTPSDRVAPTLTSWYNDGFRGGAVTVEYTRNPSRRYRTVRAGRGILRANLAAW